MDRSFEQWLTLGPGMTAEAGGPDGVALVRASKQGRFLDTQWHGLWFQGARRWMALAHVHYFVHMPHWGITPAEVPGRTVFLVAAMEDGFGVLVPLLDGDFQCEMEGGEAGVSIRAEAGPRGAASDALTVAVAARGDDVYQTIDRAMSAAIERMGVGKRRVDKPLPAWVDELGWCTYDAFYNAVDEQRILDGLQTFSDAGFHPGYLIVDGGWQHVREKWTGLVSFEAKRDAFTDNRLAVVAGTARERFGVKHVGAWHTLFGSMRGVDADAEAMKPYNPRFVYEPKTNDDVFGSIDADKIDAFYDGYHGSLAADGVDFVKVDFQCALPLMTYDQVGRCEAARRWQDALQGAAAKHLPAGVLNCMSMSTDMVYHTHTSNVSRCSDDFYPNKPDAHPRHVRQNLYNALWLSRCVMPDWDMFWSGGDHAAYHAVARAVSGGPVYVSDRPGESDVALLNRFIAADGKMLRADQPAQPTGDTIFHNPVDAGRLVKAFTTTGEAGVLGLFHPHELSNGVGIDETVAAANVAGLEGDRFAVWSAMLGWRGAFDRHTGVAVSLDPLQADALTFAPLIDGVAIIGLIDKYLPHAAVRSATRHADSVEIDLRGGGAFALATDREIAGATLDGRSVELTRHDGYVTADTGDRRAARLVVDLK